MAADVNDFKTKVIENNGKPRGGGGGGESSFPCVSYCFGHHVF